MTTDKVLDKLAKLRAARDGEAQLGNTAAAEAFAGMINTLLLKHELSELDIPLNVVEDPIIELMVDQRAHGIKFSGVRVGWQEVLAQIVAKAHMCKILVHPRTNFITLVGTKTNTTVAEYAYGVLVTAADKMANRARQTYWNEHRNDPDFESGNYRQAWLTGFIQRIAERFEEARRQEVQASSNSSTALVRLNQQLVRAQAHIDEKYKKKASTVHLQTGLRSAKEAGRKAADDMAIGRKGVKGSGPVSGLLK